MHFASDRNRRSSLQDLYKFKSLIATPGNLTTGVALPANGQFFLSTTSALLAVTLLANVTNVKGTRALGNPISIAGAKNPIGFLERGVTVSKRGGAPGTVRLYVRDESGNSLLIAQA